MPLPNPQPTSSMPVPIPQLRRTHEQEEGYIYIHCVAITKNTHVTITNYKRNPIIAMSGGRVGLKHSKRNGQEAGFSIAVKAFEKLAQSKYNVEKVELVVKGFGQGRRGFLGAIDSPAGAFIKRKIVRITDATPLQIGGTPARNEKRR
jgi:small subunit ribosomal protein S11